MRPSVFAFIASLLLMILATVCFAATELTPTEQLQQCLAVPGKREGVGYDRFVQGTPGRLFMHKVWQSSQQPSLDVPLTFFTTLTASRLDQLRAQCQHWPGRLAAALYVPVRLDAAAAAAAAAEYTAGDSFTSSDLAAATSEIESLLQEMDGQPSKPHCALDVMLLYELITDDALMDVLPINQLRNYALLQTRSDLVAMIDVDLLPSTSLAEYLRKPENMLMIQQICKAKSVIVIPAFSTATQYKDEAAGHQLASDMAHVRDKAELKTVHMPEGLLYQFHGSYFRQGHDCTNYNKWLATNRFYSVRNCWSPYYEPWFIVDRVLHLPYDSVFRGFGWNKQSQVSYTHFSGFDFQVIPDGFLVHRQHEASSSRKHFAAQANETAATPEIAAAATAPHRAAGHLRAVNTRFQQQMMKQLRSKTYTPKLDAGFTSCLQQLSWWNETRARPGAAPSAQQTAAAAEVPDPIS